MKKSLQVRGVEIGAGIPKICVPIVGRTRDQILAQAQAAADSPAQIAEWRIDFAQEEIVDALADTLSMLRRILGEKLLLVTFRSRSEGGEREIAPAAYLQLCMTIAESGLEDLLDVELSAGESSCGEIIRKAEAAGVRTVISAHYFDHTPSDDEMSGILQKMEESGASILKLAVMPLDGSDVLRLMRLGMEWKQKTDKPLILISMGKLGTVTRLAGELFGSSVTFGTAGESSAPGQIDSEDLNRILHILH